MSEKIHCDHCDEVIPDNERRLTVKFGVWRGNRGHEQDGESDYCYRCVQASDILRQAFDELNVVKSAEPKAEPA